jgi:3-hydroxyacyl-[acyl-carrier-protein] dehydratase
LDTEKGFVVGQKNVTFNESFFQGHFPEVPIMPGVLILEALAQTGGVLVHMKGKSDKIALLLTVNNAKFRAPVKPGDILMLECEEVIISSKAGRIRATAKVNDKVVVEAEMGFALADKDQI